MTGVIEDGLKPLKTRNNKKKYLIVKGYMR